MAPRHKQRDATEVKYKSGPKQYKITTNQEDAASRMARRSYPSTAKSVVETFSEHTVAALTKRVNEEMNQVCSSKSNTILRQRCDGTNFSWEKIWTKLKQQLPTLHSFLVSLTRNAVSHKSLVCMIVSMMLKHRCKDIVLVQGVISALLYGNSTHKQVILCLIKQFADANS